MTANSNVYMDNPDFLDCIYSPPNGVGRIVEQCLADIGCCATTCCKNTSQTKYRWAVALISIFSALVLIALVASLLTWLYNRQKDKRQKKLLAESTNRGISPAPSQLSVNDPYAGRFNQGYYQYNSNSGTKRNF
uniref:CX domain-containing protein n=1 Tax=Syphacia muris TaxID=451379 RepID=A0A158R4U3_9BILA